MLVEHTIVTIQPQAEAFEHATALLEKNGFRREIPQAADTITFSRGIKKAEYAKSVDKLPQKVVLSFDRGRVSIAVSLEEARRLRSDAMLQKEMLLTLATMLGQRLSPDESLHAAQLKWEDVNLKIKARHRRRRRVGLITVLVCLCVVVAAIVTCIAALE